MTIDQISIFLENKFGRLNEILSILSKEDIRIIAASVADTSDYGILRLITNNQIKALQVLKENGVSANRNAVLAISVDSSAGRMSQTIESFTKAGINIEYMYCFSTNKQAILILRTNNLDAAHEVIRRYEMVNLSETELNKI
jgi:hypothetical protein